MKQELYVVGFGPGDQLYMTQQALQILHQVDLVIGYTTYIRLLQTQFPQLHYVETPMRREIERCRIAIEEALQGKSVALVSSGDSGIYGMAGILMELVEDMHADLEVVPVAGVTAASAAAAVLGAPLMHDFAVISLSDLMTPLERIYQRVSCAAQGDFVICLYNPRSKTRSEYLAHAADLVMAHRSADTPVGIVRNAGRPDQTAWLTTLHQLKEEPVDMLCIVIIGNSQTVIRGGKMITPRGYQIPEA